MKWWEINNIDGIALRVVNGLKAWCVQDYSEMNKKRGLQWSASRLVVDAPPSTGVINSTGVMYSVISTGALPVDLKLREFAFSGRSIVADIFENPTFTGGTSDPVYNANGVSPHVFELELLTGVIVTAEGDKFAPSIYALGSDSQQSKGMSNTLFGTNYILAPNTPYLLKFYSSDTQNQDIAARIEGYEGGLDVPNDDLT